MKKNNNEQIVSSIWDFLHGIKLNSHFNFFAIQVHPNYTLIQMEHFYLQLYRNGTTVYFLKIKEAICTCLECKSQTCQCILVLLM